MSPVTVHAVTKGSSYRSLSRAIISFNLVFSWMITCGWLWPKAIGAVIDLDDFCDATYSPAWTMTTTLK